MARTKASVGAKLSSGKSSKAVKTSSSAPNRSCSATPSTSKGSGGSGNPYHPRPTPKWQKPITSFFGEPADAAHSDNEEIATSSKNGRPRHSRQITSDTESDVEGHEDNDLDTSTVSNVLPPLSPDENSHKIVEYFDVAKSKASETPQSTKGKGKGKGKGKRSIEVNGNDNEHNTSFESNNVKLSDNSNKGELENGNSIENENKENTSECNNVMSEAKGKDINGKAEKRESDNSEMNSPKRIKVGL